MTQSHDLTERYDSRDTARFLDMTILSSSSVKNYRISSFRFIVCMRSVWFTRLDVRFVENNVNPKTVFPQITIVPLLFSIWIFHAFTGVPHPPPPSRIKLHNVPRFFHSSPPPPDGSTADRRSIRTTRNSAPFGDQLLRRPLSPAYGRTIHTREHRCI